MKRSVVVSLGLCLLAASASVSAQPVGQNQPPDQWVANCNYEKGKDCTVSAMIDGGPNNLLGTFLIVSYSVAYTTLSVVADGLGSSASMQVDNWPFVSTRICTGGACSFDQGKSADLLQALLRGSQVTVQLSTQNDGMAGPLSNTLQGFTQAYQRAVQMQQSR